MGKIAAWEPKFSVGHPVFDEQHQELFALCQQAADCVDNDSIESTAQFYTILHDLVDYTSRHFRAEEKVLREHNYPQLEEHRAEHVKYELRLTEFLLEANCGTIDKASLYHYLSEWWTHHILQSDMGYRDFLQNQAPSP